MIRTLSCIANTINVPDAEKLSGSGSKSNIGTSKVVHSGFREHGVVLKLRLAQRRAVTSNQDELGYSTKDQCQFRGTFSASRSSPRRERKATVLTLAVAHVLERRLVAEAVLARLDDERETRRNGLGGLGSLGLFGGGHCVCVEEERNGGEGGGCLDGALGGDEKCAMSVDAHRIRFKLRLISAVNSVGVR